MKADGLERFFRQGPVVMLCIFIGPTDEYSDVFEPLLPYYVAICEDSDVMPFLVGNQLDAQFLL